MAKPMEDLTYCGEDCEECNIYRAMMYKEELKPETVNTWQEHAREFWNVESLKIKDINCQGCRYEGDDVYFGFKTCPIKGCSKKRELISCGLCPDVKNCPWDIPRENFSGTLT